MALASGHGLEVLRGGLSRAAVWAVGIFGEVGRLVFAFAVLAEVEDLVFAGDHGRVTDVLGAIRRCLDHLVGDELA